jgi:hypothetical protein
MAHSTAWRCVDLGVERGWPATAAAFVLAVAYLVGRFGDRAGDATLAQVGPVSAGRVGLVTQYPIRCSTRSARSNPRDTDPLEHGRELRTVTSLPRGHHQRQRLLALFGGEVGLGGEPTSRPTQPMIGRLDIDSTRRFGLQIPLFRAPAACWCARQTVESTLTSQAINPAASARACSPARILFHIPLRCQRRNKPYTVCHGP